VRSDDNLARSSFRLSPEWKRGAPDGALQPHIDARLAGVERRGDTLVVHSLSGNERNHYFANRSGRSFEDWSALSGLDNPADGRGFAVLDYDRDGCSDLALVNANQPLFNLYRNEMPAAGRAGGMIAVRFVGGNRSSSPSSEFGCRDGYGAQLMADLGDQKIIREHRCGDGFAAQHSATMMVGLGARAAARSVSVRWPSGRTATTSEVPEGTLLTVYENPADGPGGEGFARSEYRVAMAEPAAASVERPVFPLAAADTAGRADGRVRVYTTLATWCPSCRKHLPAVRRLQEALATEGVELVAVPIDVDDDEAKLSEYARQHQLPSRVIRLDRPQRERAAADFGLILGETPPLPSTVITDAAGRVLAAQPGVPSVSALRRLLHELGG
jgi:thiol-disulfide isomerase/thioredoxin